jgi:hypothetical protein
MSGCDDLEDGVKSSTDTRRENIKMKKIMSLMLGMSLVLGAATVAFAQDKDDKSKKSDKKKGGKKKGDKTKDKTS